MLDRTEYLILKDKIYNTNITDILRVCRNITIPMNIASSAIILHTKYIYISGEQPDGLIYTPAFVMLACKLNDYHIKLGKIVDESQKYYLGKQDFEVQKILIEEIQEVELNLCVLFQFDFNIPEFYIYFYKRYFHMENKIYNTALVLLNDSFYLPLNIFYTRKIILKAVIILAEFIHEKIESLESSICGEDKEDLKYIIDEIVTLYVQ
ncbi:hypothetical protein SLOPH_1217 [Spraguea lophii 42_110]|uniref:Cyclin n=1 Tax=Spraguea lophii (strain 42_110) TaxID=1358809 RepID=S7W6G3_SPRLO|nr:hypothetical protein SLOPH_1217 [Spraguea lophii 42_110]